MKYILFVTHLYVHACTKLINYQLIQKNNGINLKKNINLGLRKRNGHVKNIGKHQILSVKIYHS